MSKKKEEIPSLDEMTMRDLFALFAMQGLCANTMYYSASYEEVSEVAGKQADAMLKERSK